MAAAKVFYNKCEYLDVKEIFRKLVNNETNQACVCSPTVRIIAFQAIDPGSTPGKRKFSFFLIFDFHFNFSSCLPYALKSI